jgi:hypothetical protein
MPRREMRPLVFADLDPGDIVDIKENAQSLYPKEFNGPKLNSAACKHPAVIHAKVSGMLWVSIVSLISSHARSLQLSHDSAYD